MLLTPGVGQDTYLAPGFVDLQVNGFANVDYNNPSASMDSIAFSMDAIFSTGVTRFFPTIITASPENTLAALANLTRAREKLPHGEAMAGFHLEGAHISPDDGPRGAHPARWVRPPDIKDYKRCQDAARGNVRLVTLAPEWPEATRYIEHIVREGVVASIGHTAATPEQIQDAVSAGATLSTHLGNAGHPSLPRRRNYLWEQLAEDRLAASFIVDDYHLPDAFLRVALRAKGIERSILVTDAVGPSLGEVELDHLPGDRVVLKGGTRLAGSGLRMDRAIANTVRRAGISLEDAVAMASVNPARIVRVHGDEKRHWAGAAPARSGNPPGPAAPGAVYTSRVLPRVSGEPDLVRFRWEDGHLAILETFLSGERVFSSIS